MTKWCFDAVSAASSESELLGEQHLTCQMDADCSDASEEAGGPGVIVMRCVPYDVKAPAPWGQVQFAQGCFADSLEAISNKEQVAFIQGDGHRSDTLAIVASTDADGPRGTVSYEDREDGLYAEVVLADTTAGRDIYELVSTGTLRKCSVGVYIDEFKSSRPDKSSGKELRSITAAIWDETSFVPRPRFSEAEAKVKSDAAPDVNVNVDMSAFMASQTEIKDLLTELVQQSKPETPEIENKQPRGLRLLAQLNKDKETA